VPYFIDLDQQQVVVLPPGRDGGPRLSPIDNAVAGECELVHGQPLSGGQVSALRAGDVERFRAAGGHVSTISRPTRFDHVADRADHADGSSDSRSDVTQRAYDVASFVEKACWWPVALTLLLGIFIALHGRTTPLGTEQHPYVLVGLLTATIGAFQWVVVAMVALYVRHSTQPSAARVD
jgi:hypothetical protein